MTRPLGVADAASVGPMGLRVVKVGGSLFDFDGLAPALRAWLASQPPLSTVLVAGGGKLVDVIREADARFQLGEETSHWLGIRAMSVTAQLLAALLPEAELAAERGRESFSASAVDLGEIVGRKRLPTPSAPPDPLALRAENASGASAQGGAALALGWKTGCPFGAKNSSSRPLYVIDVEPFLRHEEHELPDPLPHTWQVTSDSIAARLAVALAADELVLLKSASGSTFPTREAAAAAGYVDEYFPRAAAKVSRVRWVNLRSKSIDEGTLD